MSDEKPCPFCKSTEISFVGEEIKYNDTIHDRKYSKWWGVSMCLICESTGPVGVPYQSKEEAYQSSIDTWNKRES